MNVGKAIYYLLANNAGVSAITTRIYPEVAPQDAAAPFIVYRVTSVDPDDTHDGPAVIDEVRIEVICVSSSYDEAADLGGVARVALDRVYGTYNTVNVESIQFDDVSIYVRDQPRQYGQELTFIVRVKRDDVQIATGSPIEDITLGRLADVTIDDPLDRQVLAYDEATGEWINDGAGSISIPVYNNSITPIAKGRALTAVGSQGDRIKVEPYAQIYGGLRFVGIAGEEIPGRSPGHATVYGEIRGLDTSNFAVGTLLYPVDTVNPTFFPFGLASWAESTNTSPLVCAMVTRQQQNTGRIFVRMWAPGYRNTLDRLDDVRISSPFEGALLRYDADQSEWRVPPQTSKSILEGATETVEIYYYSITTDTQQFRDAQSDTPSSGYKIVRKIWYSTTAQEDIDSGTWTLLETLADNATYAQLVAAFEDQLKTSPGGDTPVSIKTTWAEVEEFEGLLDTYTGAAAAYSLRRLTGTYTGSAIRVRRASDDTEQDIGFDSNGDLDTTALATFCSGTNGFVKTWYDQSGNGNDATQATTTLQPKIYDNSTGVITEGGEASLQFDGTDDYLATGNNLGYTGAPFNMIAVASPTNGGIVTSLLADGSDRNYINIQPYNDPNESTASIRDSAVNTVLRGGATQEHSVYNLGAQNSSSASFYRNGSLIDSTTSTLGNPTTANNFLIGRFRFSGSALYFGGTIQEVVYYNSDESSNRTGIETNINDYFGIYTPFTTGLLDDYSGAAAAYSLRRLSSTYTGPAIRVRRASDNAEQDIEFDIEGNLNTGALASFCSGTDGFVKVWYDQSGNGNDAEQTTTTLQPKIYDSSTGVVTENGKPAALFLDSSDIMRSDAATEFDSVIENELYVVCSYETINAGNQYAAGVQIGGGTRGVMVGTNSVGNYVRYHCDGAAFEIATGGSITADTQILHGGTYDGTTRHARLNGASVGTNTDASTTGTADNYFIGRHPGLTAGDSKKIQEIIIYPAYAGNEAAIETNINDYYSIYTP